MDSIRVIVLRAVGAAGDRIRSGMRMVDGEDILAEPAHGADSNEQAFGVRKILFFRICRGIDNWVTLDNLADALGGFCGFYYLTGQEAAAFAGIFPPCLG